MERRDWITIAVVGVIAVTAFVALAVMSLLEVSEYITFAVAMTLMLVILVGSYIFLLAPQKQREERDTD